jgi:thiamine biosynthesis lipoprotein
MTEPIQQIEFKAMGSQIMAAVKSDRPEVGALLADVPRWFAEWEQALSRFRPESELSKLNNSGSDAPRAVSDTLWRVLNVALNAANSTNGMVTPAVLNAVEAAGYATSFDQMPHVTPSGLADMQSLAGNTSPFRPTSGRIASLIDGKRRKEWRRIKMYPAAHSVQLPMGLRLDLGGVAKGWAADEAALRLAQLGPSIVNAGGDIAVAGPEAEAHEWLIGVAAPSSADGETSDDAQLELLSIISGGVATSGRDYRKWKQAGKWMHHIIDPRTGKPARTDVITTTVVAPTACMAEVGAKMALLLGGSEGLEWIEARPSLAALIVLENGQVIRSSRLSNFTWNRTHVRDDQNLFATGRGEK